MRTFAEFERHGALRGPGPIVRSARTEPTTHIVARADGAARYGHALQRIALSAPETQRTFVPGSGTIQRIGPAVGSSPALIAQYTFLTGSASFQKLNQLVTTNQNITLLDSSLIPGQPVDYNDATHTIRLPLDTPAGAARPLADVRDDILWEMHNASIKGALGRTADTFLIQPPGVGASTEEKKNYPYMQAAYAISKEWEEWVNIAEHDLRTQKINADPNLGVGPHVTRTFAAAFAVADQGWYVFETYLRDQIANGHTVGYDPAAANADWVGKRLFAIARSRSTAVFQITQKQVDDWKSGKRSKIKSISNNPFKSLQIIAEARRGT